MEILTVASMLMTAVATGVLAIYTKYLRDESKKTREQQTAPNIVIYLERNPLAPFVLDLVVKNVGLGPAYEVTFSTRSDVVVEGSGRLDRIAVFAKGQRVIAPNQEIRNAFGTHKTLHNIDTIIKMTYFANDRFRDDQAISETFILNPEQFEGSGYFIDKERQAILDIANSLESIDRSVTSFVRNSGKDDVARMVHCLEEEKKANDEMT